MFQTIIEILFNNIDNLPLMAFLFLLLAGFNLPISEDLVIIIASSISATMMPKKKHIVYLCCVLGVYSSDIIAFITGRYFGAINKRWKMRYPR